MDVNGPPLHTWKTISASSLALSASRAQPLGGLHPVAAVKHPAISAGVSEFYRRTLSEASDRAYASSNTIPQCGHVVLLRHLLAAIGAVQADLGAAAEALDRIRRPRRHIPDTAQPRRPGTRRSRRSVERCTPGRRRWAPPRPPRRSAGRSASPHQHQRTFDTTRVWHSGQTPDPGESGAALRTDHHRQHAGHVHHCRHVAALQVQLPAAVIAVYGRAEDRLAAVGAGRMKRRPHSGQAVAEVSSSKPHAGSRRPASSRSRAGFGVIVHARAAARADHRPHGADARPARRPRCGSAGRRCVRAPVLAGLAAVDLALLRRRLPPPHQRRCGHVHHRRRRVDGEHAGVQRPAAVGAFRVARLHLGRTHGTDEAEGRPTVGRRCRPPPVARRTPGTGRRRSGGRRPRPGRRTCRSEGRAARTAAALGALLSARSRLAWQRGQNSSSLAPHDGHAVASSPKAAPHSGHSALLQCGHTSSPRSTSSPQWGQGKTKARPHSAHSSASGVTAAPQRGQASSNSAPQLGQTVALSSIAAPHSGHNAWPHSGHRSSRRRSWSCRWDSSWAPRRDRLDARRYTGRRVTRIPEQLQAQSLGYGLRLRLG